MKYKQIYDNYLKAGYLDTNSKNLYRVSQVYKKNYARFLPTDKNAKILDIGCGTGQFLLFLKQEGYTNFAGVDIGKDQIYFCKRHITEKVKHINNLYLHLKENFNSFDLIIMLNVIEHFPKEEIINILKLVKSALRENGRFIVQTINMSNFSSSRSRYTDFTHEVGFTERSLANLLRVVGFSQISIFGNKNAFKFSVKRIIWLSIRKIWFLILKIIYLVECGIDSPKIFSTLLIGIAEK